MPTFLEIVLQDADGRPGVMRVPVNDVALPAGYQAKLDALTALFGGTTANFLTKANVKKTRVVIESVENDVRPAAADIRLAWKVEVQPVGEDTFTFQIPGRNDLGVMTTEISKGVLLDTDLAVWTAFLDALAITTGLELESESGATAVPVGARAITTKRVAPRI